MEISAHISYRPAYSELKVFVMRIIRFLQTGYLLHLMGIFSIFMVYFFGNKFLIFWNISGSMWRLLLYGYAGIYFFSLIFFSILDARSRYQNYKMAKDRLFKYGFDARLLKPFVYSRCQRDAIGVAAKDLGLQREWIELKYEMGFRWYHMLPAMIIRNPSLLFTKEYWIKTLFVRTYHSKYFLW